MSNPLQPPQTQTEHNQPTTPQQGPVASTLVNVRYTTHLPGGQHWSLRLRRGAAMRLSATTTDTNVGLLCYNPENLLEHLNLPDTLKCQHTVKLTRGNCLYSDMGRIFASIIEDDLGWHDCIGGNLTAKGMIAKGWQTLTFQQARNERTQTGEDSFLIELAKYGLGWRDMPANLNLFSKVAVDEKGHLHFVPGHCRPGHSVTLRFEMDTLVILHTCPHPLDPSPTYPHRGVDIALGTAPAPDENDVCYRAHPENARGFANNFLYHLGLERSLP